MKTARYFTDKVIYLLAICVALSFIFQIFKQNTLVNVVYVISLLIVFFCYIASGLYDKIAFLITVITAIASIAHGFRTGDFDYYTHILISLCIYMCFDVSSSVKLQFSTFKKIARLFLLTALLLIGAYYFGPLKNTQSGHRGSIALNMHNPNAAGMWLTCIFILLVYASFQFKFRTKVLYLGAAAAILPILLATESRNSFLAALLFVVCLVAVKFFGVKRVPNAVLVIISVLPLIVFFFYMFVIAENLNFWSRIFSQSLLDKSLGSRIGIWTEAYDSIRECFLVGNYYRYYDTQMHNSLMTVFCRFGAPVLTLTCMTIYRALRELQDKSSLVALISLSAVLFTGCFEASIFVGVAGLYLMVLLLPACASIEIADTGYPTDVYD